MITNNSSYQKGFILASVLWGLAIMFVVVGIFHTYVQQKLAIGTVAKQSVLNRLDRYSTQQTLYYILTTRRETAAGFTAQRLTIENMSDDSISRIAPVGDEVYVDGTPFVGIGRAIFSVQDENGLYSLNAINKSQLRRYLTQCKFTLAVQDQLIDSLDDYIDADDHLRARGAERFEYTNNLDASIANDVLRTPVEIMRVKGWLRQDDRLGCISPDVFSVRRNSLINLNAMPLSVLQRSFFDGPMQQSPRTDPRHSNPIRSIEEFGGRFGLLANFDIDEYGITSGGSVQIKIWDQGGSQTQVISLQLTPFGDAGPWQVDYEYSYQRLENTQQPVALGHVELFGDPMAIH